MRVAVDTGGTFTDVVVEVDGELTHRKLPSAPTKPERPVVDGALRAASDHRETAKSVAVLHGTTVGTNALLERSGARVALFLTAGFEDLLRLGRQTRPDLYALQVTDPAQLVADHDIIGVRERMGPHGEVLEALAPTALEDALSAFAARLLGPGESIEACAICLLHAYANDAHELALVDALQRRFPALPISRSSDILAEFREFERASTTAANAYLAPLVGAYLDRLASTLAELLPMPSTLRVMQSNGGLMSASEAARYPVHTALSGPAGGILGAVEAARRSGLARIVTFDMGGTSTDVAFGEGEVQLSTGMHVGGVPIHVPMANIHTVGAGGGSLAYLDGGGALRVGPRSARAEPGPACYQRGGTLPTVTDANLVLGRLDPTGFLGGEMTLDVAAARRAVQQHTAVPLGLSVEQAAEGIVAVANAAMARALRVISVEAGHHPSGLTLVAFGGAGGLHACSLAGDLGIPRVLVPREPGLLSAFGMLHARPTRHVSQTLVVGLRRGELSEGLLAVVGDDLLRLRAHAAQLLAHDGAAGPCELTSQADLRYVGQGFELRVDLADSGLTGDVGQTALDVHAMREMGRVVDQMLDQFEAAHEASFGYRLPGRQVELVTLRVRAQGRSARPPATKTARGRGAAYAQRGTSRLFAQGRTVDAHVFDRARMGSGDRVPGPAVISEYSATTFVPAGWQATVDVAGALLLVPVTRGGATLAT